MIEAQMWDAMKEIYQKCIPQRKIIDEYEALVDQNNLLQSIKDLIINKNYANPFASLQQMSSSQFYPSTVKNVSNITTSEDEEMGQKSKFAQEFQESVLDGALSQVRNNCSIPTYDAIKRACETNKAAEYLILQKNYEKIKKENQDLMVSNMTQHKQKSNILWQLNLLKPKIKLIDQQKAKMKKQMDILMDKEQKLFKIQASLAFKEKISLEGRKRYQRQRESALQGQTKLKQAIDVFQSIWKSIENKCNSIECPQQCWRKDVMKKCKDKIMEQRDVLKAQELQIEREYQIMANLSEQFKKLFVNNQSNSKSTYNL